MQFLCVEGGVMIAAGVVCFAAWSVFMVYVGWMIKVYDHVEEVRELREELNRWIIKANTVNYHLGDD